MKTIKSVVFMFGLFLCMNHPISAAPPARNHSPGSFDNRQYQAALSEAATPQARSSILSARWERVMLAIGHVDVVEQISFHRTLSVWLPRDQERINHTWTVQSDTDLDVPITNNQNVSVEVKGNCEAEVVLTNGKVLHIQGDLLSTIRVGGQCEIVIGGNIGTDGNIEILPEGIVHIFVGGDVHGSIRGNDASYLVWINGDFHGRMWTGKPSTIIYVMGNSSGTIAPNDKPALLYLVVHGYMAIADLEAIAQHDFTAFIASIGSSDHPAGVYGDTMRGRQVRWTVHSHEVDLPQETEQELVVTDVEETVVPKETQKRLTALEPDELYETVSPAVVQLLVLSWPFNPHKSHPLTAAGYGFFVSGNGHVMTTYHQIRKGVPIYIRTADDEKLAAQLLYGDPIRDVALLKVNHTTDHFLDPAVTGAQIRMGTQASMVRFSDETKEGILTGKIFDPDDRSTFGSMFRARIASRNGDSGSPVVDRYGYLLGLVRGGSFERFDNRSKKNDLAHCCPRGALEQVLGEYADETGIDLKPGIMTNDLDTWIRVWGLRDHSDESAKEKYGVSILTLAASHGNKWMIESLVQDGADINARDSDGNTPLLYAMERWHQDAVKHMLKHGAKVNSNNSRGLPQILLATFSSNVKTLEHYIAQGHDVNEVGPRGLTALMSAAGLGQIEMIERLMQAGAELSIEDDQGITALGIAVSSSTATTVSKLLEFGADLSHADALGRTALMTALRRGDPDIIEVLIEAGPNFDQADDSGVTVLGLALLYGGEDTLCRLIQAGADVNYQNGGITPLMAVARDGIEQYVELLINAGAEVNKRNTIEGSTALLYAALWGDAATVEALLNVGADLDATNDNGVSAMDYAKRRFDEEGEAIVQILREALAVQP